MRTDTEHVDCGSCSKCCKGEFIPLTSGDDPANYPGIIHKPGMGAVIADIAPGAQDYYLPKGADGNCAYLPPPEWRAFQRRWVRPAIIHSNSDEAA